MLVAPGATSATPSPVPTDVAPAAATSAAPAAPIQVPRGSNMVANGDFTVGDMNWVVDDGAGNPVTHSIEDGALCVVVGATTPFASVRWPLDSTTGASLSAGNSYLMTYDAWADDPTAVALETKIEGANAPFTDYLAVEVNLTASSDSHAHGFNTPSNSTSGIVFELSLSQGQTRVCFDNVVLKWP
jgi:hypothetical protein